MPSDWASYGAKAPPPDDVAFNEVADEYASLMGAMEKMGQRIKSLREQIAERVPNEPGEHEIKTRSRRVVVKIPEKMSWDTDVLDAKFASTPLPDYVNKRLNIPKAKWEKLSEEERADLRSALTRSPGTPKIFVETL